jgi:hypothetical protein
LVLQRMHQPTNQSINQSKKLWSRVRKNE